MFKKLFLIFSLAFICNNIFACIHPGCTCSYVVRIPTHLYYYNNIIHVLDKTNNSNIYYFSNIKDKIKFQFYSGGGHKIAFVKKSLYSDFNISINNQNKLIVKIIFNTLGEELLDNLWTSGTFVPIGTRGGDFRELDLVKIVDGNTDKMSSINLKIFHFTIDTLLFL